MNGHRMRRAATCLAIGCACATATRRAPPEPGRDPCDARGAWELVGETGTPPGGPRFEVVIDSLPGAGLTATVTSMVVGNVGVPPSRYAPMEATVSPDCRLRFEIRERGAAAALGVVEGTLAGDTVSVTRLSWAGADAADPSRVRLVRRPRGRARAGPYREGTATV